MALMVLDVVEFEIARPKAFAQPLRMSEHAKITIAYLRDARALNIAGEIRAAFAACTILCLSIHGFQ